ncbi:hypothetical protein QUF64_00295 [Anaerolineales bacterium HSG6]|nr:hypothetical protein [Anaerolineales bacterium HSG6]MDM8532923.1 hypothetical protein [Anaerolineales bacterium HSG25]
MNRPNDPNDYLNILKHILVLGLFWGVSGYVVGASFEFAGIPYQLGLMCGSLNLIIGMVLLKGLISTPRGDRMFFVGPQRDEDGDWRVGCLWLLPGTIFIIGLVSWFWGIVFRFIDK